MSADIREPFVNLNGNTLAAVALETSEHHIPKTCSKSELEEAICTIIAGTVQGLEERILKKESRAIDPPKLDDPDMDNFPEFPEKAVPYKRRERKGKFFPFGKNFSRFLLSKRITQASGSTHGKIQKKLEPKITKSQKAPNYETKNIGSYQTIKPKTKRTPSPRIPH